MKQLAPENIKPAIEKAIEFGIEWVELDICLTKDGHHVILHDNELDRITNGKGLVEEHTLAEILALDEGIGSLPNMQGNASSRLRKLWSSAQVKSTFTLTANKLNLCDWLTKFFKRRWETKLSFMAALIC